MSLGLKRVDLQRLAEAKYEDAVLLLRNRRSANAYYLAGYAVELGLKACISKLILQNTLPEKGLIEKVYSQGHKLAVLVGLAGLTGELDLAKRQKTAFDANWSIVVEWEPDSRYRSTDIYSAQLLLDAIGNLESGVLQWIKMHW
jgi:hypothetical protein